MRKVWHKDLGLCLITCETGEQYGLAKENSDLRVSTLVAKNEVEPACTCHNVGDIVRYNSQKYKVMGHEYANNRVVVAVYRKDGTVPANERYALKPHKISKTDGQLRMAIIDANNNIVQVLEEI